MNKTKWFEELHKVFNNIAAHKTPYMWKSQKLDLDIIIHLGVFSPKYFEDSEWYAEKVGELAKGMDVLEVGSGTGLLAVYAAKQGAKFVATTDINLDACKNTTDNFKLHNISNFAVSYGNPYSKDLESKFDIIIWNHPFNHEKTAKGNLLKAAFDFKFHGLQRYVAQAEKHLKKNGRLLLGSGNFASPKLVEKIAKNNGYNLDIIAAETKSLSTINEYQNKIILYELKKEVN